MTNTSEFEVALSGGHHNSLGNTEAVADQVRADISRLDELIDTYSSDDEVVRLRVSSALKRIAKTHPDQFLQRLRVIEEWVVSLRQPSAMWSLSEDYRELGGKLSAAQRQRGIDLMKDFLTTSDDWIVINHTIETLGLWARKDPELADWLVPRLVEYSREPRKSIAGKARRHLAVLAPG
jgi:hypothetical protein